MSALPVTETMVSCPCCGADMPSPVPLRALVFAPLTHSQRNVLEALISAHPRPSTKDALINAVWGLDPNGGPLDPLNVIAVHCHRINKAILPFGWRIQGDPGAGSSGGRRLYRVTP